MKSKYQFGGSTDFFSMLASLAKPSESFMYDSTGEQQPEEIEQQEDDEQYQNEEYNDLLERFNDLSNEYENLKRGTGVTDSFNDGFLDFLFSDTSKSPLTFSDEELSPDYYANAVKSKPNYPLMDGYSRPASTLDPDKYLQAIFGNEGGKTGVDLKNVKGRASGRFGIIPDARKEIWQNHFKDKMNYSQFDRLYNTDADFEYQVARKLAEDKIRTSKSAMEAFGSWYYPDYARRGIWDIVPEKRYGNRLTVGQYAQKALSNYKKFGGKVAKTEEELKEGLNNPDYDKMILDLPPQYNLIKGLDNGQPIHAQDEIGNEFVLNGSNDLKLMFGKVKEQKL